MSAKVLPPNVCLLLLLLCIVFCVIVDSCRCVLTNIACPPPSPLNPSPSSLPDTKDGKDENKSIIGQIDDND